MIRGGAALLMLAVACVIAVPVAAMAQAQQPDPWEQARFRTGPLAFTPIFHLTTLGWDSNVFNQVNDPKGDFTARGDVTADWWLRGGDVRVHGINKFEGVYFAKYDTERAFNHYNDLTVEYRLNRLRPYASGGYRRIKDRPGYEIDARARHTETAFRGGLVARLTAKSSLDLSGGQTTYRFDGDQAFEGTSLAEQLNRKNTSGSAAFRYALTPLTTVSVTGGYDEERFDDAPIRDNKSFRIVPGVSFDPVALLKGSAQVGYVKFDMLSPEVPDYSGIVANVNLAYVLMARTRFTVGVRRDIDYSFERTSPYYVLTDLNAAVRQALGRGWDFEVRGSRQKLAYRTVTGAVATAVGRVDRIDSYGGGIGYTLGEGVRLAFNVNQYQRKSDVGGYNYDALRYGIAATYEF